MRIVILVFVASVLLLVFLGQVGLFSGKSPADLGTKDGQLKRPSKTENSVSSQANLHSDHPMRAYAQIAPLAFAGEPQAAWDKLVQAVGAYPRTAIVTNNNGYLYAQSTTLLLRFTDDVEFVQDAANKVIHVRSASRLGRKDFGTNRKRIEAIRANFAALNP